MCLAVLPLEILTEHLLHVVVVDSIGWYIKYSICLLETYNAVK